MSIRLAPASIVESCIIKPSLVTAAGRFRMSSLRMTSEDTLVTAMMHSKRVSGWLKRNGTFDYSAAASFNLTNPTGQNISPFRLAV